MLISGKRVVSRVHWAGDINGEVTVFPRDIAVGIFLKVYRWLGDVFSIFVLHGRFETLRFAMGEHLPGNIPPQKLTGEEVSETSKAMLVGESGVEEKSGFSWVLELEMGCQFEEYIQLICVFDENSHPCRCSSTTCTSRTTRTC
ncbi:hypothetical protein OS493_007835 [Desmophyllum pertusum]|uniref:Uncharacterized protein n=1 Tax=Desmophyllum pertusum TaxID=174260 RepID=A0A9W9YUZ1_9CNID|nr:hypothetical protein OS493_007835 [Desmophyllum pertusum]